MKIILLFSLLFQFTVITAQEIDTLNSCLFVSNNDRMLQFKPNKFLHVKSTTGQHYWGKKYILQDESIIFSSGPNLKQDTIQLKDISMIKGRTYGSGTRLLGGSLLIVGGPALGFYPVLAMAFGIGPGAAFLMAVPFFVMSGEGVRLLFPRRFNTAGKWHLETMIR